jgi:hypothetical protein
MAGYLPQVYERFGADYPAVMEAFRGLAERLHEAGPLSPRASSERRSGRWRCSPSPPRATRPPWLRTPG